MSSAGSKSENRSRMVRSYNNGQVSSQEFKSENRSNATSKLSRGSPLGVLEGARGGPERVQGGLRGCLRQGRNPKISQMVLWGVLWGSRGSPGDALDAPGVTFGAPGGALRIGVATLEGPWGVLGASKNCPGAFF